MNYLSTIDYLFGLQKYGMKFGLDNTRMLLDSVGNPQNAFRSVHIAGTNGKGSTAAMTESIIRTGGQRTGLFTSPHLVSFTERIRINGQEITEDDVVRLAGSVRDIQGLPDDFSPTFFEVVTCMAFIHFMKMQVDWAVVEVGMGGRLDATNVIFPEVSVITSINFDHKEFLGSTLREIAREKAGVIKQGVPVVTADQHPEVMEVLENRAAECGSALHRYGDAFSAETVSLTETGISFHYRGDAELRDLSVPLAGAHQMVNAALAIRAAEIIIRRFPGIAFDIKKGLQSAVWPGRLEFLNTSRRFLIDGAHNPAAARTLSTFLERLLRERFRRIIFIIGIMGDKDIEGILQPLLPLASECIFASPAYGRAAPPAVPAAYARTLGHTPREAASISGAIALAEDLCDQGDLIVITGSFYTIGEAKEALGHKAVLARLRE